MCRHEAAAAVPLTQVGGRWLLDWLGDVIADAAFRAATRLSLGDMPGSTLYGHILGQTSGGATNRGHDARRDIVDGKGYAIVRLLQLSTKKSRRTCNRWGHRAKTQLHRGG